MTSQLTNFSMEISYGAQWIELNDHERYIVHAETLQQRQKSFRRITASSAIVEGDVLVHSVADMITETVKVIVSGQDMIDMHDNVSELEALFEQFSYTIRVTKNDYREAWTCQAAPAINVEGGQVYLHNAMAIVSAQVPRYPAVVRERLSS